MEKIFVLIHCSNERDISTVKTATAFIKVLQCWLQMCAITALSEGFKDFNMTLAA